MNPIQKIIDLTFPYSEMQYDRLLTEFPYIWRQNYFYRLSELICVLLISTLTAVILIPCIYLLSELFDLNIFISSNNGLWVLVTIVSIAVYIIGATFHAKYASKLEFDQLSSIKRFGKISLGQEYFILLMNLLIALFYLLVPISNYYSLSGFLRPQNESVFQNEIECILLGEYYHSRLETSNSQGFGFIVNLEKDFIKNLDGEYFGFLDSTYINEIIRESNDKDSLLIISEYFETYSSLLRERNKYGTNLYSLLTDRIIEAKELNIDISRLSDPLNYQIKELVNIDYYVPLWFVLSIEFFVILSLVINYFESLIFDLSRIILTSKFLRKASMPFMVFVIIIFLFLIITIIFQTFNEFDLPIPFKKELLGYMFNLWNMLGTALIFILYCAVFAIPVMFLLGYFLIFPSEKEKMLNSDLIFSTLKIGEHDDDRLFHFGVHLLNEI